MPKQRTADTRPKTALKAERIQAPSPEVDPLKAERIQELLRQLPAWRLRGDDRTLTREYRFPGRASALAFVHWIAAFTADYGRPARVEWAGGSSVTVLLPQHAGDGLREADFGLARQMEGAR